MDDRNGYEEAKRRNLQAVGTLGVLAEAAGQQLIDLPQVLDQL
jgi:predicted nucleic acid-binding protein